jgi:hypothetical protein
MGVSSLRNFTCWIMVILCPLSLVAADTGSAIVHNKGGVWVNGAEVADSTVIFPGDVLETKLGFVANLDAEGSSVLIQGESIVKFETNSLTLEHGSLSVNTSTEMIVHVNCLKVEPISNDRTQYDVKDVSGKVEVAANKDDVKITESGALRKASSKDDSSESGTVHEGHREARDESSACGAAQPKGSSNPVNTKWLEIGGGGGAGALVLCLLLCRNSNSSSVSPTQP